MVSTGTSSSIFTPTSCLTSYARVNSSAASQSGSSPRLSTSVSISQFHDPSRSQADRIPSVFNIPCALAKNIQTLLICRFFAGFFASAPLTLAGGTLSDIWDNNERGFAIALFAAAPYGGPVLGPIVGGFVGETVGWRWIFWVCVSSSALPHHAHARSALGEHDLRGCRVSILLHHPRDVRPRAAAAPRRTAARAVRSCCRGSQHGR